MLTLFPMVLFYFPHDLLLPNVSTFYLLKVMVQMKLMLSSLSFCFFPANIPRILCFFQFLNEPLWLDARDPHLLPDHLAHFGPSHPMPSCIFRTGTRLLSSRNCALSRRFQAGKCTFVILTMSCYWVAEVVPLAVTSFIPMIALPFLGVLSIKQVAPKYFAVGRTCIAREFETRLGHEHCVFQQSDVVTGR